MNSCWAIVGVKVVVFDWQDANERPGFVYMRECLAQLTEEYIYQEEEVAASTTSAGLASINEGTHLLDVSERKNGRTTRTA